MDFMRTGYSILKILNCDYGYFLPHNFKFIVLLSSNNSVLYNLNCAYSSVDLITCKVPFELLISPHLLQIVRSVSSWSTGFLDMEVVEESIHEAYIDAITRAKHYVYIENQFFISLATHNTSVRNLVCETLFKRIMRAHR